MTLPLLDQIHQELGPMSSKAKARKLLKIMLEGVREENAGLVERALEAINASHAMDCPWRLNAAAECICGRLALGFEVEDALLAQLTEEEAG